MVPVPSSYKHSSRLLYTIFSVATHYVPNLLRAYNHEDVAARLAKRDDKFNPNDPTSVLFAVLIPVLVLLSGLFAGLTLGYMSLDETQLKVLAISGTPKQREYAAKIQPIRKNGHLLLVTLLLANMITNETLPVISENVLGGGVPSVVVSTTLIVIFSEILPQSIFTRHGLFLGAKMAGLTTILIYGLGIISWPVAKLLEIALGPHHGIIYRRAELKELIAMHSSLATHGGDLKTDTVTIIGATLDLQEKIVTQAMTPIKDVFMLSIDSKLDYDLLKQICATGHSRVPVYEEIEVPIHDGSSVGFGISDSRGRQRTQKVKKIIGILLVKQCVLLDPNDAVPLRKLPLNKVLFVPQNEPLLGILDRFQDGRSHMAIVSRFSREKAASVKKVVKQSLTQRLRSRVGMGDSSDSDDEDKENGERKTRRGRRKVKDIEEGNEVEDGDATLKDGGLSDEFVSRTMSRTSTSDVAENRGALSESLAESAKRGEKEEKVAVNNEGSKSRRPSFQLPRAAIGMASISQLEQSMPADAVLTKEGAEEFLQGFDPAINPLGIITLEDVLEELIGEEIYDEFDPEGAHVDPYVPPVQAQVPLIIAEPTPVVAKPSLRPLSLKGFSFLRSKSAPPSPRDTTSNEKLPAPNPAKDISATPLPRTNSQSILDSSSLQGAFGESGEHTPRGPPSVIIEQISPSPSLGSSPEDDPSPLRTSGAEGGKAVKLAIPQPTTIPLARTSSAAQVVAPVSRSSSPAPSLEAFLLERKRRMGGAGAGAVASSSNSTPNLAVPVTSVTPAGGGIGLRRGSSTKGTRFKSSPLVGDRTGVVVAEKVKEDMHNDDDGDATEYEEVFVDDVDMKAGNDEGRKPGGRNKEGPDKDSNNTKRSQFVV